MAFGGGLYVRVSERVSLQLIQADYNPAFLRDRRVTDTLGNVYEVKGLKRRPFWDIFTPAFTASPTVNSRFLHPD